MSSKGYKEDLTITEDDNNSRYIDKPKGVEFSIIQDMERDSNMLLFTGVSYLGAGFVGGTVGLLSGVYTVAKTHASNKNKINTILTNAGKVTSRTANVTASTVFTFGMFKRLLYYAFDIHEEGIIASTVSGFAVGTLYNAPKGIVRASLTGVAGAAIGFLTSLGSRNVVDK